jgi:2-polyprenyl-6-methoxyphenol hydroxylase-like FAD-dependent oxidoreductase
MERKHFSSGVRLRNLSVTRHQPIAGRSPEQQETTNGLRPGEGRVRVKISTRCDGALNAMGEIRHVGVIGAGLAGLAVGLAAAGAGMRVDLYEAEPAPFEPAALLEVVPNLLRELAALGLADACVRSGFPYQGFAMLDGDGRPQFTVPTRRLAGERHPAALGMRYGELLRLMREAVIGCGARLHFGAPVNDVGAGGEIVRADGSRHAVDLTVIASGAALPQVAGRAAMPVPLESLPQQWCYAVLPRPVALDHAAMVVGSRGGKLLAVPLDTRSVGVAALQSADAPAAPRDTLAAQGSLLKSLAAHWTDDTPTFVRPVRTGVLAGPWHAHGVLRVGQSAHVLPPHFGQGAAQALEDAVVLGELLRARLHRDALLNAFTSRRGARARQVQSIVTQAARWDLRPEPATDLRALARQLSGLVEHAA